jgi:hypothetical protein
MVVVVVVVVAVVVGEGKGQQRQPGNTDLYTKTTNGVELQQ